MASKKLLFRKVVTIFVLIACLSFLLACNETEVHTHIFTETVYDPTCETEGHTLFKCDCGYSYTDKVLEPINHDYEKILVPSTCTAGAYYLYSCKYCNSQYSTDLGGDFQIIPGHNYVDDVCTKCGDTRTVKFKYSMAGRFYIVIEKYIGNATIVEIPSEINGTRVGRIQSYAFANTEIVSVTIPNTITDIHEHAFYNCSKLQNVSIEKGQTVMSLADYTFFRCESLKSIIIPINVAFMGKYCFDPECFTFCEATKSAPNNWNTLWHCGSTNELWGYKYE